MTDFNWRLARVGLQRRIYSRENDATIRMIFPGWEIKKVLAKKLIPIDPPPGSDAYASTSVDQANSQDRADWRSIIRRPRSGALCQPSPILLQNALDFIEQAIEKEVKDAAKA